MSSDETCTPAIKPTTPQSTTPETDINQLLADFHELETRLREANEKLLVQKRLLQSIQELSADCAAYREALVKWSRQDNGCCRECSAGNLYTDSVTGINHTESCSIGKALSLTSGKKAVGIVPIKGHAIITTENYVKFTDELIQLRADNTKLKALVDDAEKALLSLKAAVNDVLLPAINKHGKSEFWLPEQMQFSQSTEATDAALTAISNYRKNL